MRHVVLASVALGIFCGAGRFESGQSFGQQPPAGQRREGRAGAKPGEFITRPDMSERWKNKLQVGSVAPDFTLPVLTKGRASNASGDRPTDTRKTSSQSTEATVSLRELCARKPAVLIFGSMTCPPFRSQLDGVDDVYEQFKDRVEFLFIYIREAHPDSVLSVVQSSGAETLLKVPQATDLATRTQFAAVCQRTAQLAMPIAIDSIDNKVGMAYAGWPNRMVVVDIGGKVIFARDPSPGGTNAQRLRTWLQANLASFAAEQTPGGPQAKAKQGRAKAARGRATAKAQPSEPVPNFADVSYGPDESNKIDFWKANSATPNPLVVFIHGGGFRGGDKSAHNPSLLKACLNSGISYASINYRLSGVAPYPAQMQDSARAIQFMRDKAAEWNIDPQRVACTGGSAGAGISLWLAFHDDLADPKSKDAVARQSTRLSCALPTNMQCTYDPREIKRIVPGDAYNVAPLKQLQGLPATFNWDKDPISAELDARLRDCSPITHLTKDDPPVFAMNNQGAEKDGNIHHPNFGRHLKKEMDKIGIECEFHLTSDFQGQQATTDAMLAFLMKRFDMKAKEK